MLLIYLVLQLYILEKGRYDALWQRRYQGEHLIEVRFVLRCFVYQV